MNSSAIPIRSPSYSPNHSDDYGIVIAGHGSRDSQGVAEFEELVAILRQRAEGRHIEHGFLEFAIPTIDQAVAATVAAGKRSVVVVPALLAAASHAKNDMPNQLSVLQEKFPETKLHYGAVMDLHPLILKLCQQKIIEAEAAASHYLPRFETCLVVVGRGTSDSDANSDISKLARMLEEGMGFAASFVCYSGTARPFVSEGLKVAAALGYKRIIVLPYLLFDGVLVKRIYRAAEGLKKRFPEVDVIAAKYLGVHPDIADVFLERAHEGVEGRAHMNCSMCKYRVEIVGFESQVGNARPKLLSLGSVNSATKANATATDAKIWQPYKPHPIEKKSFEIIELGRDWSKWQGAEKHIRQRLVHTAGDFNIVEDLFFSPGAADIGIKALLRCRKIICDVTMVASGIKRALLKELDIVTWCAVHERETELLAESSGLTRCAANMRRAFDLFGNDVIIAIGDAPTALAEVLRLVKENGFRPQLIIGLPVGFVGTAESKAELKRCLQIPRITNSGTRGGSPWAAAVINALMIESVNKLAGDEWAGK